MAKTSKQTQKSCSSSTKIEKKSSKKDSVTKGKRTRKSIPRESPQQRSSVYRGVTRHRWTGRYEAHLWDKNCWNESQNKKGRQVYLGAYDEEEVAAHAYDLAALKYWGHDTILNFPVSTYEKELQEMEGQSKEEYIGSLRRKSSGFSRGVSKFRGVARHHHNGRWEARIGRVFGNKYLYLGTYATQEEAATAYDMAAIEYRGLNAVTNFDLSRYIKWLKPNQTTDTTIINPNPNLEPKSLPKQEQARQQESSSSGETVITPPAHHLSGGGGGSTASSALGLLLQSSKFKEMLELTSSSSVNNADISPSTPSELEPEPPRSSFPDDIQTYFDCHDSGSGGFGDDHDNIFGDFASAMFPCELDT